MQRRKYLAIISGTLPLAGCSNVDDVPTINEGSSDGGEGNADAETDESTPEVSEESNETEEAEPEPEFEIRSIEVPEEVEIGEEWSYTVTVANTGNADGTYTGVLEIDSPDFNQPETRDISIDIPAGEEVTAESDTATIEIITEITIALENKSATVQSISARLYFGETYEAPTGINVEVEGISARGGYRYDGVSGETRSVSSSEGQQFAFVDVVVENVSGSVAVIPSSQGFAIRVGQRQYDATIIRKEEGKYQGGQVGPGVIREGWIAYDIPEELEREDLTIEWFETGLGGDHGARWANR